MNESELNVAVAKAEGWTWFWSKHNHWVITDPEGHTTNPGFGDWTDFDPHTGQKNVTPAVPSDQHLHYYPASDPAEAMRLLEKYRLELRLNGTGYDACGNGVWEYGETPCIAICKAVVALAEAGKK